MSRRNKKRERVLVLTLVSWHEQSPGKVTHFTLVRALTRRPRRPCRVNVWAAFFFARINRARPVNSESSQGNSEKV